MSTGGWELPDGSPCTLVATIALRDYIYDVLTAFFMVFLDLLVPIIHLQTSYSYMMTVVA